MPTTVSGKEISVIQLERRLTIFAKAKIREHLDPTKWRFVINRRAKSYIAVCIWDHRKFDYRIEVNAHWIARLSEEELRDTVLHEIAHAIAGLAAGHGPRWVSVCLEIGAKPEERYDVDEAGIDRGYKYKPKCPQCGLKAGGWYRKPTSKKRKSCGDCCPSHFNEEFLLEVVKVG